jgi:hypothetical protein
MRWVAAPAAVVIVMVTTTGCARDGIPGAGGDPLAGRTFLSESVTEDGTLLPLVNDTRISLRFDDDRHLRAHAGCNTLFAEVSTTGGRLTATGVGSTEMGCDPPRPDRCDAKPGRAAPAYGRPPRPVGELVPGARGNMSHVAGSTTRHCPITQPLKCRGQSSLGWRAPSHQGVMSPSSRCPHDVHSSYIDAS